MLIERKLRLQPGSSRLECYPQHTKKMHIKSPQSHTKELKKNLNGEKMIKKGIHYHRPWFRSDLGRIWRWGRQRE